MTQVNGSIANPIRGADWIWRGVLVTMIAGYGWWMQNVSMIQQGSIKELATLTERVDSIIIRVRDHVEIPTHPGTNSRLSTVENLGAIRDERIARLREDIANLNKAQDAGFKDIKRLIEDQNKSK